MAEQEKMTFEVAWAQANKEMAAELAKKSAQFDATIEQQLRDMPKWPLFKTERFNDPSYWR